MNTGLKALLHMSDPYRMRMVIGFLAC